MEGLIGGKILLVGEGDFSFAVSLVHRLSAQQKDETCHVIATSLETETTIHKHQDAARNMTWLQEHGASVMLNVDATSLHTNSRLGAQAFSNIVFNFPHVGGKSNHKKNRKLLSDFFRSAVKVLEPEGRVLVTLCKGQGGTPADQPMRAWHDSWQVVSMAANSGFILTDVKPFIIEDYTTYTSTGFRSQDKGFHTNSALTHVFQSAAGIEVPNSLGRVCVKFGDVNFACSRHLVHLLDTVSFVKTWPHHPVHKLYRILRAEMSKTAYGKQLVFTDRGLQQLTIGKTCTDGKSRFSSCEDCQEKSCHSDCYMYTLTQCESDDADQQYSDIMVKDGQKACCCDFVLTNYALQYADAISKSEEQSDEIVTLYGAVLRRCHIKPNLLPLGFHMVVLWPVNTAADKCYKHAIDNEVDQLVSIIAGIFKETTIHVVAECSNDSHWKCSPGYEIHCYICSNKSCGNGEMKACIIGEVYRRKSLVNEETETTLVVTLDLLQLACDLLKIPDKRLLLSIEPGILKKFEELGIEALVHVDNPQEQKQCCTSIAFRPVSLYPMKYTHDMSFWEHETKEFDEFAFLVIIRDVTGMTVSHVELLDRYRDTNTGKWSRCYRLVFQSPDCALSYDTSWKLQSVIRLRVQEIMGVSLR
ncbi:ferredoxin-fold anticodon-binding domain-containing protein 1 homolog isoform X2 [Mya arenaria]|nr:ferredoxin-fold anticodon-binding domain-containing protein 1 homolog isoform X2 [Mya arenaria]XP_052801285.1 ferredoxin-fold anticodon-binding domain-containing protein 1 homolog isoform X2 [Mya arenaria]